MVWNGLAHVWRLQPGRLGMAQALLYIVSLPPESGLGCSHGGKGVLSSKKWQILMQTFFSCLSCHHLNKQAKEKWKNETKRNGAGKGFWKVLQRREFWHSGGVESGGAFWLTSNTAKGEVLMGHEWAWERHQDRKSNHVLETSEDALRSHPLRCLLPPELVMRCLVWNAISASATMQNA